MDTNRQQFGNLLSTPGAYLTGVMGWNFNHCPTSFFRFVGQKVKEHAPSRIRYAFGKVSIFHHAFNIQIFYINSLVVLYIEVGCLMQKVLSLVADFLMRLGNQYASLVSMLRAFLLPGKTSLSSAKQLLRCPEVLRRLNLVTVRINTERFKAYINPDFVLSGWELPLRHVIAGKGHVPLASRIPANSDSLYVTFNGPGQKEFKLADVFDGEIAALKFPTSLFEREGVVAAISLKTREASFAVAKFNSLKECLKRFIESLKNFLKTLRSHSLEFRIGFLEVSELPHLLIYGYRNPILPVCTDPLVKGEIIENTAGLKPLVTVGFGLLVYPGLIQKGLSHEYL